ncbi:hypothetical protein ACTOB_002329 [Actinoplanes oblitus]|uniref:ABC-2 type transporter domain-containing protein n=1 Tax=Actinoplanes oblitus TaxID=3040509 RepID=A0ABY8WPB6_9ACTN|nr:hypothetical protein [Actinoplanes oblitus]WIM98720.1 hypothetical protein ACTOB_002329 [Actinoplanes oblitus]
MSPVDAVHLELRQPPDEPQARQAISRVAGLRDVALDGRTLSARADDGAAAAPARAGRACPGRHRMTTLVTHTYWMTNRRLKVLIKQPAFVVILLVQPAIWLFLFGNLFRRIVELPGFGAGSYLDYIVPGVVAMTAVSSNMWSGMGVLEEI